MNFSKENGVYAPEYYALKREKNRLETSDIFRQYQKPLLKLVNSWGGRLLLGMRKEIKNKKIHSITPNTWTERLDNGSIRATIRGYDLFTKKLYYPILLSLQYNKAKELLRSERNSFQYAYLAQYASLLGYFGLTGILSKTLPLFIGGSGDPIYASSGNGHLEENDANWTTARNSASAEAYSQATGIIFACSYRYGNYGIYRGFFPFDTSGIGSGATVTNAVLSLCATGNKWDQLSASIVITGSTQASISSISLDDFNNITLDSPTEYASRMTLANWNATDGTYNNFTFNDDGKNAIDPEGNTKICTRNSLDVDNTTPSPDTYLNRVDCYSSAQSGTDKDPKLVVTYTTGSASASPSATPSVSISPSPSISVSATPSVSESVSVSASPSVSISLSLSASPSVSASVSISASPSVSISKSPSISPSISVSATPSVSASVSVSATPSVSVSLSPSVSASVSVSATPSVSESVSISLSPSVSASVSESVSESATPSVSASISESATPSVSASVSESLSPSVSISLSPSVSASISVSLSPSVSESISISLSPSISVSLSASPSPSSGFADYTKGNYAELPANDDDLEEPYSAGDIANVATKNDEYVGQTGFLEYMIHQYKNFVGDQPSCQLEWEGQTTFAPTSSTVYLQIYNRITPGWETVDSDNFSNASTDFVLKADIADLTDYKDASNVISSRIYQLAG